MESTVIITRDSVNKRAVDKVNNYCEKLKIETFKFADHDHFTDEAAEQFITFVKEQKKKYKSFKLQLHCIPDLYRGYMFKHAFSSGGKYIFTFFDTLKTVNEMIITAISSELYERVATSDVIDLINHRPKNCFITAPSKCGKTYLVNKLNETGRTRTVALDADILGVRPQYDNGGGWLLSSRMFHGASIIRPLISKQKYVFMGTSENVEAVMLSFNEKSEAETFSVMPEYNDYLRFNDLAVKSRGAWTKLFNAKPLSERDFVALGVSYALCAKTCLIRTLEEK